MVGGQARRSWLYGTQLLAVILSELDLLPNGWVSVVAVVERHVNSERQHFVH